ncbi:MAG: DUF1577 domain-containing protein [Leptospira sp.]|nr:DUF1577 domain-containing protein [Leptospira sp.]
MELSQHIISPVKVIKQSERDWETITESSKIKYILKEYMMYKELILKGYESRPEIFFGEEKSDGSYIFKADNQIPFSEKEFSIFKTLNKHIEVTFELLSANNGIIHCKPLLAKIAKVNRKYSRIIDAQNLIVAHNFMVSKEKVDISKVTGFSGQLVFNDVEKDLKSKHPGSRIVSLTANTKHTEESEIMKRTKKIIFVKDTETMESSSEIDCLDLKKYYEEDLVLEDKKHKFKTEKIKSFIYYPISFHTSTGPVIVGYCYTDSNSGPLPDDILQFYKETETNVNKRILDANITNVATKQNIVNICEGGILLDITDPELMKTINLKSNFTMDITFKLQAPLRFAVDIRHIEQTDTSLFVGVEIFGSNDTEKAMDSYRSYLHYINKKNSL